MGGSEVSAPPLALPVVESGRLQSFDFEAILFPDVIILIRERLQEVHYVSLVHFLASLRHVLVLVVRLLLDHGLGIDGLDDFILGELLRLEVLAQRSLLIVYIEILGSLVEGPLRDRQGPLCQS